MRKLMCVFLLCLLLPCAALGEAADVSSLLPLDMHPQAESQALDLYCGPTQGFYRHAGQTIDLGQPYVLFGQYDCWAMVAQGTKDAFGPVGWVEAGSIPDLPQDCELAFEDGFAAMIEEDAKLTDNPLAAEPYLGWDAALSAGTPVTVLARLDGWLYIQAETGDTPLRAFVPMGAIY